MPKLAPPNRGGGGAGARKGGLRRAMWGPHTMSQNEFWGEHWTSEGVKTFFFIFGLHLMFGGKLDVGAPEDDFGGATHCLVSALLTQQEPLQHFFVYR